MTKKVQNSSPTIGMVTGRDNMKTYTFTTARPYKVDPVLRDLEIKFVRMANADKSHSQYLIDLEPFSPHISTLMEHAEVDIKLEEINLMPTEFKAKLLTDKEYEEKRPRDYDRGNSRGGYERRDRNSYGGGYDRRSGGGFLGGNRGGSYDRNDGRAGEGSFDRNNRSGYDRQSSSRYQGNNGGSRYQDRSQNSERRSSRFSADDVREN